MSNRADQADGSGSFAISQSELRRAADSSEELAKRDLASHLSGMDLGRNSCCVNEQQKPFAVPKT